MQLSEAQRRAMFEQGYVHLPHAISSDSVAAALRAINASLGREGLDPRRLGEFNARSFCPELTADPVITDLYERTPLRDLAEASIGTGQLKRPRGAQIALRFPQLQPAGPLVPHIDGMYYPGNGVPKGMIYNFTALAGVLLSDVPAHDMGNFVTWPGTHRLNANYFRAEGPRSLEQGMPRVSLPEPQQLVGRAGDVVLCHYLLSHGAAANLSPHVRYAVYFRLEHAHHERDRWASMTDEWMQWQGIRGALA